MNVAYLEMKHSSPSNKFKLLEVHHTAVNERKSIAWNLSPFSWTFKIRISIKEEEEEGNEGRKKHARIFSHWKRE